MGAVIGTGSYSLIDGSTIRTPGVGVYLADTARTNMENHGVKPDVFVENTPEDNLAGRDRQLEVAVREVMKDLKPSGVGREKHQGVKISRSRIRVAPSTSGSPTSSRKTVRRLGPSTTTWKSSAA